MCLGYSCTSIRSSLAGRRSPSNAPWLPYSQTKVGLSQHVIHGHTPDPHRLQRDPLALRLRSDGRRHPQL